MVRAMFVLNEVTEFAYGGKQLKFDAQYDSSILDQSFAKATPSGSFTMRCDNPVALAQFTVGRKYYFDVHEVPLTG